MAELPPDNMGRFKPAIDREMAVGGGRLLGRLHWDFNSAMDVYVQAGENEAASYGGHIKGQFSPSTILLHELGHAQDYDNVLKSPLADALARYLDETTEQRGGNDDQYDFKEERRNTIQREEKYIRQINAWEKKNNPTPQYQPLRFNHKGRLNTSPRRDVGVNQVSDPSLYKNWLNIQKAKGIKVNDGAN